MGIIYIDIHRLHQTPMANRRIRTLDSKKKKFPYSPKVIHMPIPRRR